jgi:hypothetical protein
MAVVCTGEPILTNCANGINRTILRLHDSGLLVYKGGEMQSEKAAGEGLSSALCANFQGAVLCTQALQNAEA